MFEPLIKVLLKKLDVAAEAYLERQQIINLLAVPGTVLFLLLFWAFSGAGGFMLLLGLFLTAVEVGIAVGLFLLKDKYEDQLQEWASAADAIEAHLTGGDVFGEWNDFLQNPASDPELEQIRATCQVLPDKYPPTEVGEYCGAEGIELMQESIERLRVGIVSKGYEDFLVWWAARQEAKHGGGEVKPKKKEKKSRRKKKDAAPDADAMGFSRATAEEADAMMRVAKMSGGILDHDEQERIDREAEKESKRARKEAKREAKRATKTAKRATKQALKQEKKLRHRAAMMESMEDEMLLYQEEEHAHFQPHQVVDQPMQAPPRPQHVEDEEEYAEEERAYEPKPSVYRPQQHAYEEDDPAHHMPIRPAAPPPPPAPKRRRQRGLSEAAAIQQVMRSGLTAHHYDDAQHRLAERLGRQPKPSEVVKALKAQFSKKAQKRAAKKEKAERRGKKRDMGAFRIDAGNDVPDVRVRRPAGAIRTFARAVAVLCVVGATPFALWRVPRPETRPIEISGEVHHQLLDHAPDIQHQLRTPFEELLGYKPVMLTDGERLYVSEEDYGKCWPESWDEIYAGRYSVMITAEVTTLLFGGYSIATVTSAERVDRPVAKDNSEFYEELEAVVPPDEWRPTRRIHRPRLGR